MSKDNLNHRIFHPCEKTWWTSNNVRITSRYSLYVIGGDGEYIFSLPAWIPSPVARAVGWAIRLFSGEVFS